jgi:hypothetical protein
VTGTEVMAMLAVAGIALDLFQVGHRGHVLVWSFKQRYVTLTSDDPSPSKVDGRRRILIRRRQNVGPNHTMPSRRKVYRACHQRYGPLTRRVIRLHGLLSRTIALLGMSSLAPSLVYLPSSSTTAGLDHTECDISSIFKTFNFPRSQFRIHLLFFSSISMQRSFSSSE